MSEKEGRKEECHIGIIIIIIIIIIIEIFLEQGGGRQDGEERKV
jgi:hypothetical protein